MSDTASFNPDQPKEPCPCGSPGVQHYHPAYGDNSQWAHWVPPVAVPAGAPAIAFSVTAGSLPPGLSLDSNLNLTGTPTQAGDFSFEITATDSTP